MGDDHGTQNNNIDCKKKDSQNDVSNRNNNTLSRKVTVLDI